MANKRDSVLPAHMVLILHKECNIIQKGILRNCWHKGLLGITVVQLLSHVQVLRPHQLQHAKPLCPSPSPEVCPSSCPLHQWQHPAISFSEILFSFCAPFFSASGTFPVSQLFASSDQNTVVSVSSEYWGLIFVKIDCYDFFAVQGALRNLLKHHN